MVATAKGLQMVTYYTYSQALRLYRAYGVRVPVLLSPAAVRIAQRARSTQSTAGLRELQVVTHPAMVRGTFQSETDFQNELLAMRCSAHTMQVQLELHA